MRESLEYFLGTKSAFQSHKALRSVFASGEN